MENQDKLEQYYRLLELDDKTFIKTIKALIKFGIRLSREIEELREELENRDGTYQTQFTDIDFAYHFTVSNQKIEFCEGTHNNPDFEIYIRKNQFIQMIKQDSYGNDALMKGQIKTRGTLNQAFKYLKLVNLFKNFIMVKYHLKKESLYH